MRINKIVFIIRTARMILFHNKKKTNPTLPQCSTRAFCCRFWSLGQCKLKVTQSPLNRSARGVVRKDGSKTLEFQVADVVGAFPFSYFSDMLPCPQNWHSFGNSCYLEIKGKETPKNAAVSCSNCKKIA